MLGVKVENWWRHKWNIWAVTNGSGVSEVEEIRMKASQNVNPLLLA